MNSTLYKFDHKFGLLDSKLYVTRDYFQYYTTGLENIVFENPDFFKYTSRYDAERAEQIAYNLYQDAELADTIVAMNNQNYLWSTPFDLDAFQEAVEFRVDYVSQLMRNRMDDPAVQDIIEERVAEDIHNADDLSRYIIVPNANNIAVINKKIDEYLTSRTVE